MFANAYILGSNNQLKIASEPKGLKTQAEINIATSSEVLTQVDAKVQADLQLRAENAEQTCSECSVSKWIWRVLSLAVVAVLGSMLYVSRIRGLRETTIQHLGAEKNALEQIHDPSRTSSGLTNRGNTPKD